MNAEEREETLVKFFDLLSIGEQKEMRKAVEDPEDHDDSMAAILWMAKRKIGEKTTIAELFKLTRSAFMEEMDRVLPLAVDSMTEPEKKQ